MPTDDRSNARSSMLDQLDAIIKHWTPVALRGEPVAANIVLRALELQAKLFGLGGG